MRGITAVGQGSESRLTRPQRDGCEASSAGDLSQVPVQASSRKHDRAEQGKRSGRKLRDDRGPERDIINENLDFSRQIRGVVEELISSGLSWMMKIRTRVETKDARVARRALRNENRA